MRATRRGKRPDPPMSRRCVQEGRVGTVTARCAILLALTLAVPQTLRAAPGDLAPGAVDPTFGISITPIGSGKAMARALVLQGDGKLVAAGAVTHPITDDDFAVAEFASNNGQYIPVHIPAIGLGTDHINAVVVQSDLKVVVAGWASLFGTDDFALEQLTTDLMLDTTFM